MRFPDGTGRSLAEVVRASPAGERIELAPGRYRGPVDLDKAIILRGAGDLSRIYLDEGRSGSIIRVQAEGPVVLDSLLLEGGRATRGGGIDVRRGEVRLFNVHIRGCVAAEAGGGIHVGGGAVDAERLRLLDLRAERGGAIAVGGAGRLRLRDSEIRRTEAGVGGALTADGEGLIAWEGVTVGRSRCRKAGGGQVVWMTGRAGGSLVFERVRFEGAPLAPVIVNDPRAPASLTVTESDLPRGVRAVAGLVERGQTRWR